jgi:5-methylcytosine-specific restriction endonuclease McrA
MKQKKVIIVKPQDNQTKKAAIPRALREQVWIQNMGPKFENKCLVSWCQNIINVFDFHVGHNIPESKGGATNIRNLKPICARCNLSMGNKYSISEWSLMGKEPQPKTPWWICC